MSDRWKPVHDAIALWRDDEKKQAQTLKHLRKLAKGDGKDGKGDKLAEHAAEVLDLLARIG